MHKFSSQIIVTEAKINQRALEFRSREAPTELDAGGDGISLETDSD